MQVNSEIQSRAQHYAALAMKPGWWKFARQQVADIEASEPAMRGLGIEIAEILKDANFKPDKAETWCVECWGHGCGDCGRTGLFQPIRGRKLEESGVAA